MMADVVFRFQWFLKSEGVRVVINDSMTLLFLSCTTPYCYLLYSARISTPKYGHFTENVIFSRIYGTQPHTNSTANA